MHQILAAAPSTGGVTPQDMRAIGWLLLAIAVLGIITSIGRRKTAKS